MRQRDKYHEELEYIITNMLQVYKPQGFMIWLFHEHPQLNNRSPAEAIQGGDIQMVVPLVDQIITGAHI